MFYGKVTKTYENTFHRIVCKTKKTQESEYHRAHEAVEQTRRKEQRHETVATVVRRFYEIQRISGIG